MMSNIVPYVQQCFPIDNLHPRDPLGIQGATGSGSELHLADAWPMFGESTNHAKIELILSFWMFLDVFLGETTHVIYGNVAPLTLGSQHQNISKPLMRFDQGISARTNAQSIAGRGVLSGRGDEFSTRNTQNMMGIWGLENQLEKTLGCFNFLWRKLIPRFLSTIVIVSYSW